MLRLCLSCLMRVVLLLVLMPLEPLNTNVLLVVGRSCFRRREAFIVRSCVGLLKLCKKREEFGYVQHVEQTSLVMIDDN